MLLAAEARLSLKSLFGLLTGPCQFVEAMGASLAAQAFTGASSELKKLAPYPSGIRL